MCVQSELPRVHGMCGIYSDSGVRSQMNGKLQPRMYLTLKELFQMHNVRTDVFTAVIFCFTLRGIFSILCNNLWNNVDYHKLLI